MELTQWIGAGILVGLFTGIFVVQGLVIGWADTVRIWVGALAVSAMAVIGVALASGVLKCVST